MKTNQGIVLLAVLISTLSATAQNFKEFKAKPGEETKARIEGTSNIHDWWVEGKLISGILKIDGDAVAKGAPGKIPAEVKVIIPVKSLHSSSGAPMDDVMYEKMEVEKSPDFGRIVYVLKELELKKAPGEFASKGDLIIHGVTNSIDMPVTIAKVEDDFKITGSIKLKISSFKVQAPELNLGVMKIKTGDDITVSVSWRVTPTAAK